MTSFRGCAGSAGLGHCCALACLAALLGAVPIRAQVGLPDLSEVEAPVRAKLERLQEEVARSPRDGEAWGRLAMALDAHDLFDEAKAAYRRAVSLDATDFRWSYHLACLLELSQPRDAAAWFYRAVALDPGYAPARVRYGELLEGLARFDEAREQLREARRLDPKNAFAPLGLGRIELNAGRVPAALPLLEAAYALAPDTRAVVATLSQAYFRAGQSQRARRLAEEARFLPRKTYRPDERRAAIRTEAVDLRSYLQRANTFRDVGQLAEARREIETLLRLAPDLAEAHYTAAGIYDRLGEPERAVATASRALELEPSFTDLRPIYAGNLLKLRRFDEAEAEAKKALESDPRDPNLHLVLALIGAQRGDVDELVRRIDQAYRIGTPDPAMRRIMLSLLDDLAASFADVGLWKEASERCEQALTVARGLNEPPAALAEYERRLDDYRRRSSP
ncbi:MAG TPA: tetratricopeptide repeat protein [Thermoanaerobaculia bacterium]|nr:tetratricopeptide repeat protein [Thermoanaerobaculia bacterium]